MKVSDEQTYSKLNWEDSHLFPGPVVWITKGKDNQHFSCKICKSFSLNLNNIGIGRDSSKSHETKLAR